MLTFSIGCGILRLEPQLTDKGFSILSFQEMNNNKITQMVYCIEYKVSFETTFSNTRFEEHIKTLICNLRYKIH